MTISQESDANYDDGDGCDADDYLFVLPLRLHPMST